ncbi:MAG: hypothetical protein DRH97_00230 [Chloroflexi bacterium]|nr:MAG: hypothetical protein DRH97_00230 [Chloroflexota bacterium]
MNEVGYCDDCHMEYDLDEYNECPGCEDRVVGDLEQENDFLYHMVLDMWSLMYHTKRQGLGKEYKEKCMESRNKHNENWIKFTEIKVRRDKEANDNDNT